VEATPLAHFRRFGAVLPLYQGAVFGVTPHWAALDGQQRVCAVKGGAFQWVRGPPGETLQPEATGAVMEVTKWLKPSV